MARISITRTFGPLREVLPQGDRLMQEIGDLAIARIRRRTESGVDQHGLAFTPLSTQYGEQKAKALGHARADLTVSGRMLNDMGVVAVTAKTCEISFRSQGGGSSKGTFIQRSRSLGAADKAFFHAGEGPRTTIPLRDFFGVSEADEADILAMVERELDRRIDAL